MLDWSLLLIPLAVLAIVLLLPFAGCGIDETGEAPGVPGIVETQQMSIRLLWSGGPANEIQKISFDATVQAQADNGTPIDLPLQATNVGPAAWPPSYLKGSGDTLAYVTVGLPFAAKYSIAATVGVTQGTWNGPAATQFPTLTKQFSADEKWEFVLTFSGQAWTLA